MHFNPDGSAASQGPSPYRKRVVLLRSYADDIGCYKLHINVHGRIMMMMMMLMIHDDDLNHRTIIERLLLLLPLIHSVIFLLPSVLVATSSAKPFVAWFKFGSQSSRSSLRKSRNTFSCNYNSVA